MSLWKIHANTLVLNDAIMQLLEAYHHDAFGFQHKIDDVRTANNIYPGDQRVLCSQSPTFRKLS